MGATALRTVVETDIEKLENEDYDVPLVSVSASLSQDDLFITLSNRDLDRRQITVDTDLGSGTRNVEADVLFDGQDPREHSTKENADDFVSSALDVDVDSNGEIVVDAPASSVVSLSVRP